MRQTRPFVRHLLSLLLTLLGAGSPVHAAGAQAPEGPARSTVHGVVLYQDPVLGLFVQVGGETVQVVGLQGTPLASGDRVDVTGVAAEKDGRRMLSGATVTRIGSGGLPPRESRADHWPRDR